LRKTAATTVLVLAIMLAAAESARAEVFESPPLAEGWNMISVPVYASDTDPLTGLGLTDPEVFAYDGTGYAGAATGGYEIEPSRGFILRMPHPGTIEEIDWKGAKVGGTRVSDSGSVQDALVIYDPVGRKYEGVVKMEPWKAYWVWAYEECTLELNPGMGSAEGYVYRPAGGEAAARTSQAPPAGYEAVSGASVSAECASEVWGSSSTDYSGYFRIGSLPAVNCSISASKSGYATAVVNVMVPTDATALAGGGGGIVLLPVESGSIEVTANVAGGKVYVDGEDTDSVISGGLNCTIGGVAAGTHTVNVLLDGYVPPGEKEVVVTAGQTAGADFQLVSTENYAPVADAGPDARTFVGVYYPWKVEDNCRVFEPEQNHYILDGRNSYDPDGGEVTYSWEQVAGPEVSLSSPGASTTTFVPYEQATYTFRLTVSDGTAYSQPDEVSIFAAHIQGKITFQRAHPCGTGSEIYTINADGSDFKRLPFSPDTFDWRPKWTPDGSQILYEGLTETPSYVILMDSDGSNRKEVDMDIQVNFPSYSPDGEKIAFIAEADGYSELHVMNSDFTDVTLMTDLNIYRGVDSPFYSPDGEKILFTGFMSYDNFDVFVIDSAGGDPVNLTDDELTQIDAQWMPD